MLTRAISGFLFVAILLSAILYGMYSAFFIFLVILILGIDEFYKIVKKSKEIDPNRFFGVFLAVVSFILLTLISQQLLSGNYIHLLTPLLLLAFMIELYRKKEFPFINISYTLLGMVYICAPIFMLFHLGFYRNYSFGVSYNHELITGFFLLLWTSDTGAYLSGKFFGKHKLFERISPNKTWEGSFGAALLSALVAYFISKYFLDISVYQWLTISLIIVVFGGLGDLVESMLKRSINIKDSGNILPGHGGILDRFDGLFLSVPFVYFYLQMLT